MKSLSQYRDIEYQLKELDSRQGLDDDTSELKRELESTLRSLSTKHNVLNKMNELFDTLEYKSRQETIYDKKYISVYFKNKDFITSELNNLCLLFKSIPKYIYYKELVDDKVIKHTSPTIFFGAYKNNDLIKLSIPVFIYFNDVDFMNLLDNKLQSFTRNLEEETTN